MNIFVYIYIILYITYIIFGPHYIMRIVKKDNINLPNNIQELGKRMLFLSYLSYLYNAYYFYNPNIETFLNAVVVNLLAIAAYILKWYSLRKTDPYYYSGIVMHIIVLMPVLISLFFYKLLKPTNDWILSKSTLLLIIIYAIIENKIYDSGRNFIKINF